MSAQNILCVCWQLVDDEVRLDAAADAEDQQQKNGNVIVDQQAPETY